MKRIGWPAIATLKVVLVIVTGAIGAAPIVQAGSHRAVTDATLVVPLWYIVLSPICRTLDALTLLSVSQHIAMIVTAIVIFSVWRIVVHRRRHTRWIREAWLGLLGFVGLLAVYAGGALIPRPMARIVMHDPDDVVVDFHSHTNASHDGRRTFTAETNRRWHHDGGFNVAYVSDHNTLTGVLRGMASNPRVADDQTVLLPAIELRDHGEHVNVLGVDTAAPPDPKGDWHDPAGDTTVAHRRAMPMLVLTIPGNIQTIPDNELHGVSRIVAVEVQDGSPRGIKQIQRDASKIFQLADRMNWAVVSGSDNHGWGSTAGGWSVLHIPDWQTLHPSQLDSAIRQTIWDRGRTAVRVYLRNSPTATSSIALAMTLPRMVWRMLVDLTWLERGVWVLWIVIVALLTLGYYSIWGARATQ